MVHGLEESSGWNIIYGSDRHSAGLPNEGWCSDEHRASRGADRPSGQDDPLLRGHRADPAGAAGRQRLPNLFRAGYPDAAVHRPRPRPRLLDQGRDASPVALRRQWPGQRRRQGRGRGDHHPHRSQGGGTPIDAGHPRPPDPRLPWRRAARLSDSGGNRRRRSGFRRVNPVWRLSAAGLYKGSGQGRKTAALAGTAG